MEWFGSEEMLKITYFQPRFHEALHQSLAGSPLVQGIIGMLQPTALPTDPLTASAMGEQNWSSFAVLGAPCAPVSSHLQELLWWNRSASYWEGEGGLGAAEGDPKESQDLYVLAELRPIPFPVSHPTASRAFPVTSLEPASSSAAGRHCSLQ